MERRWNHACECLNHGPVVGRRAAPDGPSCQSDRSIRVIYSMSYSGSLNQAGVAVVRIPAVVVVAAAVHTKDHSSMGSVVVVDRDFDGAFSKKINHDDDDVKVLRLTHSFVPCCNYPGT